MISVTLEFYSVENFKTPASAYPRRSFGKAAIETHYWGKNEWYSAYKTQPPDSTMRYDYFTVPKKTAITELKIGGKTVMVDDPPHWWTILEHSKAYEGHVLVAGLGLGLIVHALHSNPKVTKITVVEREPDVIELIRKYIPECNIVCQDWYDYVPTESVQGVFFDLFVGETAKMSGAAFREMITMRERFPEAQTYRILGFNNEALNSIADAVSNPTR